jgi:hypothetical protein
MPKASGAGHCCTGGCSHKYDHNTLGDLLAANK